MRPASSPVVTLWISVLCLLASLFSFSSATAQTATKKHKLSQQAPARVHPLVTTDTWTGGGGSGNTNWSDMPRWRAGAATETADSDYRHPKIDVKCEIFSTLARCL